MRPGPGGTKEKPIERDAHSPNRCLPQRQPLQCHRTSIRCHQKASFVAQRHRPPRAAPRERAAMATAGRRLLPEWRGGRGKGWNKKHMQASKARLKNRRGTQGRRADGGGQEAVQGLSVGSRNRRDDRNPSPQSRARHTRYNSNCCTPIAPIPTCRLGAPRCARLPPWPALWI